jgi:hypothetical protein
MTTADWLRYAANTWAEVDATQDRETWRLKAIERLAKHAAYLADDDTDSSVGRLSGKARSASRWNFCKRTQAREPQN